jgi:NADPH2:quinone reductase
MMRAVVARRFGGPDVLELTEVERPKPRAGEVLVRIIASGTNPVDAKLRQNGAWAGLQTPVVLGYDASGVVEELGPGVTDLKIGDEVIDTPEIFGNQHGSYAELEPVPADIVARKPSRLSHVEAAAVPLAGGTAWEALVRRLGLRVGETILIHGGAGGVGSFAVQIARAAGARVLATASSANRDTLRELGVDVPIAYDNDDFVEVALRETDGVGVDCVFDTTGGDRVGRSIGCTRPFGRIAHILPPGGDLSGGYPKNITLHGVFLTRERKRLEEMARVLERGLLRPIVDMILPLERAAHAHRRLDSGHGRGKIVLRVSEE